MSRIGRQAQCFLRFCTPHFNKRSLVTVSISSLETHSPFFIPYGEWSSFSAQDSILRLKLKAILEKLPAINFWSASLTSFNSGKILFCFWIQINKAYYAAVCVRRKLFAQFFELADVGCDSVFWINKNGIVSPTDSFFSDFFRKFNKRIYNVLLLRNVWFNFFAVRRNRNKK